MESGGVYHVPFPGAAERSAEGPTTAPASQPLFSFVTSPSSVEPMPT
jgi:hypothetical protein